VVSSIRSIYRAYLGKLALSYMKTATLLANQMKVAKTDSGESAPGPVEYSLSISGGFDVRTPDIFPFLSRITSAAEAIFM
jgi:hypothetical protein